MKKVINMKKFIIMFAIFCLSISAPLTQAAPPKAPVAPQAFESTPEQGGFIDALQEKSDLTRSEAEKIYNNLILPDVTFENNLDPYEQQDNYSYGRSPYPLIRTVTSIHCHKTVIEPGYYLLTPRKINARYYLLFKQQGKVLYTIPIFENKQVNPATTYPQAKDPYEDAPFGLRSVYKLFGIISGRRTPNVQVPQHDVKCFAYNDQYYGINVYYKDRLYKTIYKVQTYE